MNPSWEDSEVEVQRTVAVHGRRIGEVEEDVDKLGKTVRQATEEIGRRIDGFRDACHVEVEGVHAEIRKLRGEIEVKDEKRKWTRPEILTVLGLIVAILLGVLGIVLG